MALIPRPYFTDIETVRVTDKFPKDTPIGKLFLKHFNYKIEKALNASGIRHTEYSEEIIQELWEQEAAMMAEFGKICCISLGKVINGQSGSELHIKTYAGSNEQKILTDFVKKVDDFEKDDRLCAHNGMDFDFPWLRRRMMINRIKVPLILNTLMVDKKWDLRLDDTKEMWSGTQWKHMASLALICESLGIESPKAEMDGSMVGPVYWEIMRHELPFDHDGKIMETIGKYCPGDVVAMVKLYCIMKGCDFPDKVIYHV